MITRPEKQMSGLFKSLKADGNRVIKVPLIDIEHTLYSCSELRQKVDWSDIIIFTSQNTISPTVEKINDPAVFNKKSLFAIGKKTQEKLISKQLQSVVCPNKTFSTEGLLNLTDLSACNIRDKNILIIKGKGGRKKLGYNLLKRGGNLRYLDSYFRRETDINISQLFKSEQILTPDVITVTSGAVLLSLVKKIRNEKLDVLLSTPLLVVSKRLANISRRLGFSGEILIAENADTLSIMGLLKSWNADS